jgi:uncharacterized membrane protein YhaH (DUF805 family)
MNWYLKAFRQYADFRTRARRKEFWMFMLIHLGVLFSLNLITKWINSEFAQNTNFEWFSNAFIVYIFITIIPSIAIIVRRLHDQNRNRFFVLLPLFPYIGGIALIILMILPGSKGDNKYGPDPKRIQNEIDNIGK